jgi:hypothetical protein
VWHDSAGGETLKQFCVHEDPVGLSLRPSTLLTQDETEHTIAFFTELQRQVTLLKDIMKEQEAPVGNPPMDATSDDNGAGAEPDGDVDPDGHTTA